MYEEFLFTHYALCQGIQHSLIEMNPSDLDMVFQPPLEADSWFHQIAKSNSASAVIVSQVNAPRLEMRAAKSRI